MYGKYVGCLECYIHLSPVPIVHPCHVIKESIKSDQIKSHASDAQRHNGNCIGTYCSHKVVVR